MPAAYRIDIDRGVVFSTAWDVLSKQDIQAFITRLTADPDFHVGLMQLFDMRRVERLDMSLDDIRKVVQSAVFGDARQAYLAHEDALYGMARVFQTIRERSPDTIGVFRTEEYAFRWLGIENRRWSPN